ncbi:GIY-YIG nuclease family protein [Microcoleus sp. herbarium7]|uniref:GIY-YIG nuclease family protein n=1 Tax=Microcoleus sp. herbarium7 TaxID=3055435 RepID=UPI002FCFE6A8
MKVNLKSLIRRVTYRSPAKPILKKAPHFKRQTMTLRQTQNHSGPGFVYIFQDLKTWDYRNTSLCKIGLSRSPRARRYFLSLEYESDLEIRAIVFTANMKLTEKWMHEIFSAHHEYRSPGLDGYTEWFRVNYWKMKWMQIMLYAVASLVTFAYAVLIVVVASITLNLLWYLLA